MPKLSPKQKKIEKHDWQLLSYGPNLLMGYSGTVSEMVVLMACRDCGKVIEKMVEKRFDAVNSLTSKRK